MRKKYDAEFKMKVVKDYLTGKLGYRRLSKKYNLPDSSYIRTWINQYQQYGHNAFIRTRIQKYSGEFKRKVLHYIKTTGSF